MNCQHCGKPNRSEAKYCKYCAAELQQAAPADPEKRNPLEPDFDQLVGLDDLKNSIQHQLTAFKNMRSVGYAGQFNKKSLYTLLIGNTGSGKSAIPQILTTIYFKNGIITKPDVKIVTVAEFAEFSKNLATNLHALKGGVLFIDNVHQLVPAGYHAGQSTPLDKLYAELDKSADGDPIVILASKPEGFREYLKENQDVNNRFNLKFYLPDMGIEQMHAYALKLIAEKQYGIQAGAAEKLKRRFHFLYKYQQDPDKSLKTGKNGFLVKREIDKLIADHFANPAFNSFTHEIIAEDITGDTFSLKKPEEILKELDDFVGMDGVKEFIQKIVNLSAIQQQDGKGKSTGVHMMLTGNPGTGKTTLARKLGEVFAAAGILSTGQVVDVDRSKLVGQYLGETPLLVQKYCDEAMGGVLLIDEAYALRKDDKDNFGQEAIDTLIKRMEDDRGKFIVIAAGYQKEMQNFLNSNPGMKSRITDVFHLPDYTPGQLLLILKGFVKDNGFSLDEKAEEKAAKALKEMYNSRTREFGNGRDVRNFYELMERNRAERLANAPDDYSPFLLAEDIPGEEIDISNNLDSMLAELNGLTGLQGVKNEISKVIDFLKARVIIDQAGGKKSEITWHFIFTGNPGTGKTTVARIVARIFKRLGVLPKDNLVEVTDKDLVGEYTGHTSIKTDKVIDLAMGGVLFIDEAYTLTPANKTGSFGLEAVTTLLKRMEDDRGKFIVIAAGYALEMESFVDSNPGLDSRFTKKINFEDYSPEELYRIMLSYIKAGGFTIDDKADAKIQKHLADIHRRKDKRFANARTVRIEYEKILLNHSTRLVFEQEHNQLINALAIDAADIPGEDGSSKLTIADHLKELNGLIGLQGVKKEIQSLINYIELEKLRGGTQTQLNLHFIFKGRPGTGKTTVARILSRLFKQIGVLPEGQLIEVDRKDLVGQWVGHTAKQTTEVIDRAMGGVLFIDEAYTLMPANSPNDFGKEAIDTLLKRMEDDKGKFIVIAAGYSNDMDRFIQSNEGLSSRFTKEILFEDYLPEELMQIFLSMIAGKNMHLHEGDEDRVLGYFEDLYRTRDSKFANGRTVRNLFEKGLQKQANRLQALIAEGKPVAGMIDELTIDDII